MQDIEIGWDESIYFDDAETAGFFGDVAKGIGKAGKAVGKGVKAVGKVAKSVVKSPITQASVGVLAVAFPAVGIPAAAAVATANVAIRQVEAGKKTAKSVNNALSSLKGKANAGDKKAAVAVNAMQIALATQRAVKAGQPPPRPVALPGVKSFSTTAKPFAALNATLQRVQAATRSSSSARLPAPKLPTARVPTSLYSPTPKPEQLAAKLAAGGSPLGLRMLQAVEQGKAVEVPSGVVVVTGQRPQRPSRMWIGKPTDAANVVRVDGAHAVTKSGFVMSGQAVFVEE